jgi:DNA ligase-1
MKVTEILEQICTTRGSIAKSDILKKHVNNVWLKRVLHYGLDQMMPFHIVKVPKVKGDERDYLTEHFRWGLFFYTADRCAFRKVTGNEAIDEMHAIFEKSTAEEEKWMRKILKKRLSLGVGIKSVNKIYPDLIPTFEVALAQKFDLKRIKDMESVYIEPKLDGIRCFAIVENGEAKLFARSGKLISNFDNTIGTALGALGDGCYDGELMGEDFVALMRQAYRKDNVNVEHTYLSLFDYLSLEEWRSGDVVTSTKDRYTELKKRVNGSNPFINVVGRHKIPANIKEIMALHKYFVEAGYEGAMVKTIDAPYRFGRSYDVMKVKEFHDVDLPIIGLEEGTGRHAGRLGAVKINFNGVIVKVGSGFSDEQREQVWNNQDNFLGRIIEVRYQEVTPDGSLRFPTFVCFRNDR